MPALRLVEGKASASDRKPSSAFDVPVDAPDPPTEEEVLDAYSRAVSTVAARLAPSVASLRVTRRTRRGRVQAGAGSGVAITHDGFLLTSAHVVGDSDGGSARFTDGRELGFSIAGSDPLSDLAVIRIEDGELSPGRARRRRAPAGGTARGRDRKPARLRGLGHRRRGLGARPRAAGPRRPRRERRSGSLLRKRNHAWDQGADRHDHGDAETDQDLGETTDWLRSSGGWGRSATVLRPSGCDKGLTARRRLRP